STNLGDAQVPLWMRVGCGCRAQRPGRSRSGFQLVPRRSQCISWLTLRLEALTASITLRLRPPRCVAASRFIPSIRHPVTNNGGRLLLGLFEGRRPWRHNTSRQGPAVARIVPLSVGGAGLKAGLDSSSIAAQAEAAPWDLLREGTPVFEDIEATVDVGVDDIAVVREHVAEGEHSRRRRGLSRA